MAWENPKVQLRMKTYMHVTMEDTDLEGNVLISVSAVVSRDASSKEVEAALQKELDQQKVETNKITALELKLSDVAIKKEA